MFSMYQLSHQLTPYQISAHNINGIIVRVRLYDPNGIENDVNLKISSISITSRSGQRDGIISLVSQTPIDSLTELEIMRAEVKIIYLHDYGSESVVQLYDSTISDFRFDIGVKKSSYTVTLRHDFSTPVKSPMNITRYVSKRKLAYTGTVVVYVYSINVLEYKNLSIGADFTEGVIAGKISNITMALSTKKQELIVEVEV